MPTWPGPVWPGLKSKNTRSPGCSWPLGTSAPHQYWSSESRGMVTPALLYALIVSPEQSKLSGPTAPNTYGLPSWALAKSITWATTAFGAVGAPCMSAHEALFACTTLNAPSAYRFAQDRTLFTDC